MSQNENENPVKLIDSQEGQAMAQSGLRALFVKIKSFFLFLLKILLNFLVIYCLIYIPHIIPFKAVGWEPFYLSMDYNLLTQRPLDFISYMFSEGLLLLVVILSLFPFKLIANIICSIPFLVIYISLIVMSFTLMAFVPPVDGMVTMLVCSSLYILSVIGLRNRISFLRSYMNFNEDKDSNVVSIMMGTNNFYTPKKINSQRGK